MAHFQVAFRERANMKEVGSHLSKQQQVEASQRAMLQPKKERYGVDIDEAIEGA
ncbi:MAG: hypothetical protein RIS79_3447 [Verrucomicrobiota bacterium]|jgi:hypothetical protein